jgi:hypothetical protein
LADAIAEVLDRRGEFAPRAWAEENIGYANATRKVNELLRNLASARGAPWTRDIVPKKNAPALRYAEPGRYREFAADYEALAAWLRGPGGVIAATAGVAPSGLGAGRSRGDA